VEGKNGTITAWLSADASGGANDRLNITLANALPKEVYTAKVTVANIGGAAAKFDPTAYAITPTGAPFSCDVTITPDPNPLEVTGTQTFDITLTMKDLLELEGVAAKSETITATLKYMQ
jgi:hypothetical protein